MPALCVWPVSYTHLLYALSGVDFVCVPLKIVTDDGEYLDTAALDAVGMAQTDVYKRQGGGCPGQFHHPAAGLPAYPERQGGGGRSGQPDRCLLYTSS